MGAYPTPTYPSGQGPYPFGMNQQVQSYYSGNQPYNIPPQATQGNGNYLVLSNNQGLPISSLDLEDVMTRLMSGVMGKLDAMAADLRQVAINKEATIRLGQELTQVRGDFTGITNSVRELQQKEELASQNQRAMSQEIREIKNRLDEQPPVKEDRATSAETKMDLLKLEANFRKNNLILEGLAESEEDPIPDDEAMVKVKSFLSESLDFKDLDIDSAYRLGKFREGSKFPRPILFKLLWPRDREAIWKARTVLAEDKDTKVFMKEDLPPKLRAQMTALLKVAQVAKKYPNSFRNVIVKDFRIHVNGTSYSADQLESLPKRLRPSEFSTPGNSEAVVFYGRNSRFSNHYNSNFEWDQKIFSSMEQYLAYRRARIAGRKDLVHRAMSSDDPGDSKRVMNELRASPTEPKWIEERHDILYSGLLAKFAQREDLMLYLLDTENRQLGEASRDNTWGIGMTLLDRHALSPTHWKGNNLLGNTLMEVRQELSAIPQHGYPALQYENQIPDGSNNRENTNPPGGT